MIQAPDVALSTCEVTLKLQSCSRRDCGHKVVRVVAVSDFIDDGDRWTRIITEPARSQSPLWKSHDPPDVDVSYVSQVMSRCTISVNNEEFKGLCHGNFAVFWSKLLKYLPKNLFCKMKLILQHREENIKDFLLGRTSHNQIFSDFS